MNFSALASKELLIKGFSVLSGISGVSVGSWYSKDAIRNLRFGRLSIKDNFSPRLGQCFKVSFGEFNFSLGKIYHETSETISDSSPSNTTSSPNNTKGCTTMKLTGEANNYVFDSETVVMNDKVGIVVWTEIHDSQEDSPRHQVYFLEKDDNWKIKFGFITTKVSDQKVSSPDEKTLIVERSSSEDETTHSGNKEYSGKWTKGDKQEHNLLFKGVFEDLTGSSTELLAKYIYRDNQLYEHKKPVSIKGKSEKWFEPFKNLKGKWDPFKP